MSTKKRVVVTSPSKSKSTASKPTTRKSSRTAVSEKPLTFGKKNYLFMLAGLLLIILGWMLMSGGAMPSPDVWDESIIYSFRRITLAPICIIAGLVLEIVGIFKV